MRVTACKIKIVKISREKIILNRCDTFVTAGGLDACVDDFSEVSSEHPTTFEVDVWLVVYVGDVGGARGRKSEEVGSVTRVETNL